MPLTSARMGTSAASRRPARTSSAIAAPSRCRSGPSRSAISKVPRRSSASTSAPAVTRASAKKSAEGASRPSSRSIRHTARPGRAGGSVSASDSSGGRSARLVGAIAAGGSFLHPHQHRAAERDARAVLVGRRGPRRPEARGDGGVVVGRAGLRTRARELGVEQRLDQPRRGRAAIHPAGRGDRLDQPRRRVERGQRVHLGIGEAAIDERAPAHAERGQPLAERIEGFGRARVLAEGGRGHGQAVDEELVEELARAQEAAAHARSITCTRPATTLHTTTKCVSPPGSRTTTIAGSARAEGRA